MLLNAQLIYLLQDGIGDKTGKKPPVHWDVARHRCGRDRGGANKKVAERATQDLVA